MEFTTINHDSLPIYGKRVFIPSHLSWILINIFWGCQWLPRTHNALKGSPLLGILRAPDEDARLASHSCSGDTLYCCISGREGLKELHDDDPVQWQHKTMKKSGRQSKNNLTKGKGKTYGSRSQAIFISSSSRDPSLRGGITSWRSLGIPSHRECWWWIGAFNPDTEHLTVSKPQGIENCGGIVLGYISTN